MGITLDDLRAVDRKLHACCVKGPRHALAINPGEKARDARSADWLTHTHSVSCLLSESSRGGSESGLNPAELRETASPPPCLLPLLQCIADAGLALTDAQREAATSLSEQIDEMNKDDFDVIPDDPDFVYDERELAEAGDDPVLLRQLVEKLAAQAARKREREEESD